MKKTILLLIVFLSITCLNAKEKGFSGRIDVGYGFQMSESYNTIQANLIPGYQINDSWFVGVGVGYRNVDVKDYSDIKASSMSLFPIFANVEWTYNNDSSFDPFVSIKGGYAIGSQRFNSNSLWMDFKGQAMGSGDIGCKFSISDNCFLTASVYYEYLDLDVTSSVIEFKLPGENQNAGIRVGFGF